MTFRCSIRDIYNIYVFYLQHYTFLQTGQSKPIMHGISNKIYILGISWHGYCCSVHASSGGV